MITIILFVSIIVIVYSQNLHPPHAAGSHRSASQRRPRLSRAALIIMIIIIIVVVVVVITTILLSVTISLSLYIYIYIHTYNNDNNDSNDDDNNSYYYHYCIMIMMIMINAHNNLTVSPRTAAVCTNAILTQGYEQQAQFI